MSRPFIYVDLFIDDDTAVASVNPAHLCIRDDNLRVVVDAGDSDDVLEAFLVRCLDAVRAARTASALVIADWEEE